MWVQLWPWLLGAVLVVMAAGALWLALRRPGHDHVHDLRLQAFDHWLTGDLIAAREALREYVGHHPHDTETYFQLATLMRLTGEPGRAAALYQSLAVRQDLPPARRLASALGLAEGFLDLGRHEDAATTLDEVADIAKRDERWYRLRFAMAVRTGNDEAANDFLRSGEKHVRGDGSENLGRLRAAWLTDRTLTLVRGGELDAARQLLDKAKGLAPAAGRVLLVRALLAGAAGDADATVKAIAEGVRNHPDQMAPAMTLLTGRLLDTSHAERLVPELESACGNDAAPAEIWAALARIYEKLGRRDDALRLLGSKRGDPRLTPDVVAPLLGLLTAELPDAAFSRVWNQLSDPGADRGYCCTRCDRRDDHQRWFCDGCLAPDSFVPADLPLASASTTAATKQAASPRS